jgi:ferredoxin--NADP+ reductase
LDESSAFVDAEFYQRLYDILTSRKKISVKDLKHGDACLHYTTWRESYRFDGKLLYETSMNITVGIVERVQPLTFTEAIRLNTYLGVMSCPSKVVVFSDTAVPLTLEFYWHLKDVLHVKQWKHDLSYDRKQITAFVRRLENYFMGQYHGKNFAVFRKNVLVESNTADESQSIISLIVEAPEVAATAKPGQFVVIRLHERGERIPLTIADTFPEEGSIRIIFQVIGETTEELATVEEGEYILDILGPLGNPIKIEHSEKPVLCIGGGVGIASIYMKAKALKEQGNHVITVIGAKDKQTLILADEMRTVSDEVYITTDDGSYIIEDGVECLHKVRVDGTKVYGGFVTNVLEALLGDYSLLSQENHRIATHAEKYLNYGPKQLVGRYNLEDFAEIIAVGPIPMMYAVVKVVAGTTDPYHPEADYRKGYVKTLVSLNPIMVDGTGMCGSCRVRIYNPERGRYETKFTCVDGPVFNGHLVDFESLLQRNVQYNGQEKISLTHYAASGW